MCLLMLSFSFCFYGDLAMLEWGIAIIRVLLYFFLHLLFICPFCSTLLLTARILGLMSLSLIIISL